MATDQQILQKLIQEYGNTPNYPQQQLNNTVSNYSNRKQKFSDAALMQEFGNKYKRGTRPDEESVNPINRTDFIPGINEDPEGEAIVRNELLGSYTPEAQSYLKLLPVSKFNQIQANVKNTNAEAQATSQPDYGVATGTLNMGKPFQALYRAQGVPNTDGGGLKKVLLQTAVHSSGGLDVPVFNHDFQQLAQTNPEMAARANLHMHQPFYSNLSPEHKAEEIFAFLGANYGSQVFSTPLAKHYADILKPQ